MMSQPASTKSQSPAFIALGGAKSASFASGKSFGGGLKPLGGQTSLAETIRSGKVIGALEAAIKSVQEGVGKVERLTEIENNGGKLDAKLLSEAAEDLVGSSQSSLDKLVEMGKMASLPASVMAAALKGSASFAASGVASTLQSAPLVDKNRQKDLVKMAISIQERMQATVRDLKAQHKLGNEAQAKQQAKLAEDDEQSKYPSWER
jgi:hypothetical protein